MLASQSIRSTENIANNHSIMSNYQFVMFSEKGQKRSEMNVADCNKTESSPSGDHFTKPGDSPSSSSSCSSRKQLIVLAADDNNETRTIAEAESRKQRIRIEPRASRRRESPGNVLQVQLQRETGDAGASQVGGKCGSINSGGKAKIPRPANAFMLFANEWRKKLAVENPRESNKDISVRLGVLWKNMSKDAKEKYFTLAREVDAAHKRKYPDYVYNPKEARLRKAMREQSREVSRQSILQSAGSSTSSNGSSNSNSSSSNTSSTTVNTPNGAAHGISGSGAFLNHPMSCASAAPTATVSSLSGNSSYIPGRIVNPWFTVGHTPSVMKPMISHRAECGGGFSAASATACYPSDFGVHGALTQPTSDPSADGLESNDYCGIGEFSDGQKWHPYQTSATPYHPRNPPMSAMTSRHAMQNVNHHGHGPWNQFCGVPLFSMSHSPVVRGPRHMVFLQDQQERHCGFPEEIPMSYIPNKEPEKCIEDAPRWQPAMSAETNTNNNLVAGQREPETRTKEHHQASSKIDDDACKEYDDTSDVVQPAKAPSKQPLPGFHQAFGSTEIGRFSRSEFFANMVGDSSGLIPDSYLPVPMFPYPSASQNLPHMPRNHAAATEEIIMPNYWIAPNFGIPTSSSNANYLTYLDVSHGMEGEWIHHPGQMLPQDYPALIERPTFLFHDNCPVLAPNQLPVVSPNNEESSTGYQSTSSSDGQAQTFQDLSQNSEEKVDSTTNTNNLHDNEDNDSLINVENTDC